MPIKKELSKLSSEANNSAATAEQIVEYLKLIDDANAIYNKFLFVFTPPFIAKVLHSFVKDLLSSSDVDVSETMDFSEMVFNKRKLIIALLAMGLGSVVLYDGKNLLKAYQKDIEFLPGFSKDISRVLQGLYSNNNLNSEKLEQRIKIATSNNEKMQKASSFVDLLRFLVAASETTRLGFVTINYIRDNVSLSTMLEVLEIMFPFNTLYEIAYATYQFKFNQNPHKEFLKQLKEWSHIDTWKEMDHSKAGSYFYDLSIESSKKQIEFSCRDLTLKIPTKIFLRELTAAFLKMGLPVIYFDNKRLVLHDWKGREIKEQQTHIAHFEKSLILWDKIYAHKNRKLKQLNYITDNLIRTLQITQDFNWQEHQYRTKENLPAIYFSIDISGVEISKMEQIYSKLKELYGNRVSINDDYLIVEGVKFHDGKIDFSLKKGVEKSIPDFQTDTSSSHESKSKYRLPKSDKSEQDETTNTNDNSNNKIETVADKIKAIKQQLKAKYPGHKVVPLNVPRKTASREFALVEESTLKQTMDSHIKDSYQTFISSLKNTAKVKSNNRGNGSSTTGLVDAIEPYRQLDGSWAISKRKFKLSNNTRVLFKSMPEETINGERVELTKATGFNPKYHRGRN